MYQVAFAPAVFAELVPWLMLNRGPLDLLIHPETGDDLADHRDHAMWLGEKLPLRLEAFGRGGPPAISNRRRPARCTRTGRVNADRPRCLAWSARDLVSAASVKRTTTPHVTHFRAEAVESAHIAGVSRFLLVSVFPDALRDGERSKGFENYIRIKKLADPYLVATDLNWVIVRPGTLSMLPALAG
jgi:hypothetical protein